MPSLDGINILPCGGWYNESTAKRGKNIEKNGEITSGPSDVVSKRSVRDLAANRHVVHRRTADLSGDCQGHGALAAAAHRLRRDDRLRAAAFQSEADDLRRSSASSLRCAWPRSSSISTTRPPLRSSVRRTARPPSSWRRSLARNIWAPSWSRRIPICRWCPSSSRPSSSF